MGGLHSSLDWCDRFEFLGGAEANVPLQAVQEEKEDEEVDGNSGTSTPKLAKRASGNNKGTKGGDNAV